MDNETKEMLSDFLIFFVIAVMAGIGFAFGWYAHG